MFYFFRFFTSADSATRGKDALTKELEEDLKNTTSDGASKALELKYPQVPLCALH